VVDLLEAVFAGDSPLTETLKPVLKTLTGFLISRRYPWVIEDLAWITIPLKRVKFLRILKSFSLYETKG